MRCSYHAVIIYWETNRILHKRDAQSLYGLLRISPSVLVLKIEHFMRNMHMVFLFLTHFTNILPINYDMLDRFTPSINSLSLGRKECYDKDIFLQIS